jgi:hypothetical protein
MLKYTCGPPVWRHKLDTSVYSDSDNYRKVPATLVSDDRLTDLKVSASSTITSGDIFKNAWDWQQNSAAFQIKSDDSPSCPERH